MTNNNIVNSLDAVQPPAAKVVAKNSASAAKLVTIYLFYPYPSKRKINNDFKHFFLKDLNNLLNTTKNQPIFFSLENALQYARFVSNHYVILKACVSETAIIGQSQALFVKSDVLVPSRVYGCYPGLEDGRVYYRNPLYKKVTVARELSYSDIQ